MAELIFNQDNRLSRLTGGEKRLAKLLKRKLEDDYLCWCNVPVGSPPRYPDFIILHPRRGVLILEVKDWKLNTLQHIDKFKATLLTNKGETKENNPLEQAREYVLALINRLSQDPLLREPSGRYQGKLCFPFGYGAVLSNISRAQFERSDLGEVIEPDRVICKDEMTESVDAETLQTQLWNCFPYYFDKNLSRLQIDRIRWHIFPDIRVHQKSLFAEDEIDEEDVIPDLVKVMDLEQEKLSRRMGEGHRVIHGVAGSGKTMILGYRCSHLAKEINKPILLLCYNVALAAKLRWMMRDKGLSRQVSVNHFHRWCDEQLRRYHVPKPASGNNDDYYEHLVQQVIQATERGQIPLAQYGAVLIDEAHDFEADWLKLVVQMIDTETNALLVLYDDAQSIYKRSGLKFKLSEVGIQARGRTRILKINYRNTAEVLAVAYEFAKDLFDTVEKDIDAVPLVRPEINIGRHGPLPDLIAQPNLQQEVDYLARRLSALHEQGHTWQDMAILYRTKFMGEVITERLQQAGIPVEWLNRDKRSRHYQPGQASVKVMTLHSSKGLEFSIVAIPGLGYMPHQNGNPIDEAKLLYVGMTRAMDELIMTYHRKTDFTERLVLARQVVAE